jgi:hypothetical protein
MMEEKLQADEQDPSYSGLYVFTENHLTDII